MEPETTTTEQVSEPVIETFEEAVVEAAPEVISTTE